MAGLFLRWTAELKGATAIEYSLIAAGVSLAVAGFIFAFGDEVSDVFERLVVYLAG